MFLIQFYLPYHLADHQYHIITFFLQRDTSDNMEASIVLSGTFKLFSYVSPCVFLEQMWLKECFFDRCPGHPGETSCGFCETG